MIVAIVTPVRASIHLWFKNVQAQILMTIGIMSRIFDDCNGEWKKNNRAKEVDLNTMILFSNSYNSYNFNNNNNNNKALHMHITVAMILSMMS